MRALVLLGGPAPGEQLILAQAKAAQSVICADKGMEAALRCGIIPDIALGDMDSVSPQVLKVIEEKHVPVLRMPAEKDETDAQLAVDYAIAQGVTSVVLLCGTGARLDHTMGNMQLLVRMAKRGVDAVLMDELQCIRALTGKVMLQGKPGDTLSILPVGQGVMARDSQGLYYPLPHVELPLDTPFAVSNVFTQPQASFTVVGGYAWVIHTPDAK